MGEDDGRQLDAALAALIERALRESGAEGGPGAPSAAERTNRLARVLAAGLRELVRAPLREALQAGYELGVQAAQAGQGPAAPPPAAGVAVVTYSSTTDLSTQRRRVDSSSRIRTSHGACPGPLRGPRRSGTGYTICLSCAGSSGGRPTAGRAGAGDPLPPGRLST